MKTASAPTASPPEMPVCAIAVAAAIVSARFFGLTTREEHPAEPERLAGRERVDRLAVQLRHRGFLSPSAAGSARCAAARSRNSAPTASLTNEADPGLQGRFVVRLGVAAREGEQHAADDGQADNPAERECNTEFGRARGVPSIRTTAIIGTGLIATPTASGRMSPIAAPIAALFHACTRLGHHAKRLKTQAFAVAGTGERGPHCR